jgi:hypothetical protein
MEYDKGKVDDIVLALLHLNVFKDEKGMRAWKGFDWNTLNRIHEKGYISNPKSKLRSVSVTDEGVKKAEELFKKHFAGGKG